MEHAGSGHARNMDASLRPARTRMEIPPGKIIFAAKIVFLSF
jgi:hypothetical protein